MIETTDDARPPAAASSSTGLRQEALGLLRSLFARGRPRPWASALVALSCVLSTGCLGPRAARAEDWLAIGFRTPRATFATFQTALRADQADLEYRCLAQEMKAAEGLNQLAYRTFREELFGQNPWLRYAADATVEGESRIAPDRVRLSARVKKLWIERRFAVELVREDFYEVYAQGELLDDDFGSFARSTKSVGDTELELRIPVPFGTDPASLSEVRLGQEWKIAAFVEVPPDAGPPDPLPASP